MEQGQGREVLLGNGSEKKERISAALKIKNGPMTFVGEKHIVSLLSLPFTRVTRC